MHVPLDDLTGRVGRAQAQLAAHVLLHPRVDLGVRADHAADLPHAHRLPGRAQAVTVPIQLERPDGQLVAERGRLGVDTVRSAHADRLAVFKRQSFHHAQEPLQPSEDEVGGVSQLQSQGRVEQVARREPEVDPPPGRPDRFGHGLDERRDVVVRHSLQLGHPLGRGRDGPDPDGFQVLRGDRPQAGPALARQHLDAEPVRELRFLRPHRRHLGQRVPRDHGRNPSASESLNS